MGNFKDFMSKEFKEEINTLDDERYIALDEEQQLHEFREGKSIAEPCRIDAISDIFAWMRGFQYCLTGHPNDGKSTFILFLMLIKSIADGWKWQLWSPEMINSYKKGGAVKLSASDIYDELAYMYLGKNIYKHYEVRYKRPQVPEEEYREALKWVKKHFFVIQPKDNKYQSLVDNYMYFFEKLGTDGIIADPFKNLLLPSNDRTDNVMHQVFAEVKLVALDTNSSWVWIAHPKADKNFRNPETGEYRMPTQFDLAGGAAWNNSMDWIGSYYRPYRHLNYSDPLGELHTLKARKQQLFAKLGKYEYIEFGLETNRFYFDGWCPLFDEFRPPMYPSAGHIPDVNKNIEPTNDEGKPLTPIGQLEL